MRNNHVKCKRNYRGSLIGTFIFEFDPTGIGWIVNHSSVSSNRPPFSGRDEARVFERPDIAIQRKRTPFTRHSPTVASGAVLLSFCCQLRSQEGYPG